MPEDACACASPIRHAVLMCHAPIVIPAIAGERASEVSASTSAMADAAGFLMDARPDVLVVLSPHTPRHQAAFGLLSGPVTEGDFSRFGAPGIRVRFPNAVEAGDVLRSSAREVGVAMEPLPERYAQAIDHGAAVPLHFLDERIRKNRSGEWRGGLLPISFPFEPTHEGCRLFGQALSRAARTYGGRWAILASGDMSHRLLPDAPAGYHPRAKEFDRQFRTHIEKGEFEQLLAIDQQLRDLAAEDVLDSVEVAWEATKPSPGGGKVLSYEGPFGVGYLVAILAQP